jgi:hypothetical protein
MIHLKSDARRSFKDRENGEKHNAWLKEGLLQLAYVE